MAGNTPNLDLKERREPIDVIMRPFQQFMHLESSGGLLLIIAAVVALVWANSPFGQSYADLWQLPITVGFSEWAISKPMLLWINDGLMAIFFLVVGLEIKREILVGELASIRKSTLPIFAAIGGMVIPALAYFALNPSGPGASGWGIPMATDIAFSLGILALLGTRAPTALKIFLAALAIVDDIGAVLVIAIFYTENVKIMALVIGAILVVGLILLNLLKVRRLLPYMLIGLALWVAVLKSGVHATIAGIVLAMTIPAHAAVTPVRFLDKVSVILDRFRKSDPPKSREPMSGHQLSVVKALETACEYVETPLQRLEYALHPWVSYFIVPVFALANAGVVIGGDFADAILHPVSLGIILGLFVGKQIGVTALSWLAVKLGLADLPVGVTWRHIYGVSALAGIGFTMSLFIAGLAFDSELLDIGKVGILAGSLLSGIVGWILLAPGKARGKTSEQTVALESRQ